MIVRRIARPMLASVYIVDGADTIINAASHKRETETVLEKLRNILPSGAASYVPNDAELVARGVGATKVGAGSLLALGKAPRFSAATLALLQLGTIVGRHNFWEAEDEKEKNSRRNGFLTSIALLGGLSITSVDSEGRPSLGWRAKQALPSGEETQNAAQQAGAWVSEKSQQAGAAVSDFVDEHKDEWKDAANQAVDVAGNLYEQAVETGKDAVATVRQEGPKWVDQAVSAGQDAVETVRKQAPKLANQAEDASRNALEDLEDGTKQARKRLVKTASRAQDKADKAYRQAEKKTGRALKRANRKADRLQKKADKAINKAVKNAERKLK